MKTSKNRSLLMPHRYQVLGWYILTFVLISVFVLCLYDTPFSWNNIIETVEMILLYVSVILLGFSKERNEDEFTMHLRMKSIVIAVGSIFILSIIGAIVQCIDHSFGLFSEKGMLMINGILTGITSMSFAFVLYFVIFRILLFNNWKRSRTNEE